MKRINSFIAFLFWVIHVNSLRGWKLVETRLAEEKANNEAEYITKGFCGLLEYNAKKDAEAAEQGV